MLGIFGSKTGIRKKLLLSYLAITVPLIFIIILAHYDHYMDKQQEILTARVVFARDIASNFDHFIKEVSTTEQAMGTAIIDRNYTPLEASEYLAQIAGRYPVFSLDYTRLDGEIYASSDPSLIGTKESHGRYNVAYDINKLSTKRQWLVTPLHKHRHGGVGFDIVTGIWHDSKLSGLMVASVDSTRLSQIFTFEVPGGGYNITDNNGMLIYQNQYPQKPMSERNWSSEDFVKQAISGKEYVSQSLLFPVDNSQRMGAQVPIRSIGWSAGSFVSVGQVLAPIRKDLIQSGGMAVVIILIGVFLGFWVSGRIVKPIIKLAEKAKGIAGGNFDEEIGTVETGDEIEDLAESFNAMRVNLKEYVGELSGLVEVGEKINLALNIPFVENAIVNALRTHFGAEAVWIALYDEKEKSILVDRFWSEKNVDFNGLRFDPGQGEAGKVLISGKPSVVRDLARSDFVHKDIAIAVGIDSAITLPLVSGSGVIGVIGIYTPLTRQNKITEKETGLLMALANQAAVAIENARLYKETRESEAKLKASNEDLRILNRVALDISSGLDLTELLEKTVRNAVDLVGADIGSIGLCDEDSGKVKCKYEISAMPSIKNAKPPKDLGLIETVQWTNKSVYTNDYRHDPRASKEALMLGVNAVAVMPLLIGERMLGALQVASLSGKVFNENDIALLEAVASQAAVAIENANLYGRERDVAETLQNALLAVPDNLSGIKLGLLYRAATNRSKVGGDFYDFIEFADGKIGIVIGDVSGKGLEAATATALAKMTIKAFAYECDSPSEVLARANRVVSSQMSSGQFITIAFIIIDPATGDCRYAIAGHPSPIIVDYETSAVRQLYIGSTPLGVLDGAKYENHQDKLAPSEVILLYTDGLLEARNGQGMFGEEGIVNTLLGIANPDIKDIPKILLDAAEEFSKGKLSDDVAIIAVGLDGEGKRSTKGKPQSFLSLYVPKTGIEPV